ncbi:GIN domain-containing protein [Pedobacter sp. GSP4]|uniref:GIN domain-containing protein n=1 Tax=Pedobacter sp. GSP4 TaxID=3453716 RepID=UPI003EEA4EDE
MKTSISTLTKSLVAAIVLSTTLFTAQVSANEKTPVKVSAPKNFTKVMVSGNVEVTLIQRETEGISYADDNTGKVKVMQDGYDLKITAEDNAPAKIVVYVNHITRVQASGDAVVKTAGQLDTQYLQVFLKGNAAAEINSDTESLYTVIEGNADLKLTGATKKHTLVMGNTQKLNLDKFASLQTEMSSPETTVQTAALAK